MNITPIKDITRALQLLLLSQLSAVSSSAQVSLLAPGDKLPTGLGVNIYLFRITESPFFRNTDWPGDRTTGPAKAPALGLELSYLLTPYAPPPDPATSNGDDAHTMLGAAMLTLYENPVLNTIHIPGFDADVVLPASILNSYEQAKITLAHTSLEELSKIWSTINQPYRLSVAYNVSLVQLTPTRSSPVSGASVLSLGLDVVAWNTPRLESLTPSAGALAHIDNNNALAANILTIGGSSLQFGNQTSSVQVGGRNSTLMILPAPTPTALNIALPADVDGGPQVSVTVSTGGRASAPLPLLITPWLSRVTPIRSSLENSTLVLTGTGFTPTPQAVRFEGPVGVTSVTSFVGVTTDTQVTVNIPAALTNGIYKVRMVLAGPANSASNSATLEVIPAVSSPVGITPVSVAGNQVHQLTVNGARLNGADVRIIIDNATYAVGANTNAAQMVFSLGRLLTPGMHTLAVSVNGSVSHDVALVIP